MDLETLATVGLPLKWVGDRLVTTADVKPRHIGRVFTAEVLADPNDVKNFETERLTGTLEAVIGSVYLVSGSEYDASELQNVRVWRREVAR